MTVLNMPCEAMRWSEVYPIRQKRGRDLKGRRPDSRVRYDYIILITMSHYEGG